jgi:small-conductance mechanosensitive channel
MSETGNNLNDALDIARYIVMPSLLIVLGHAFNYWALDLICLTISFLLIKFFWREYVEFSNHKPRRITLGAKKAHYILSIYCLVATIILIYFGEDVASYISPDAKMLMVGHFLLTYILSGIVYWYLFNAQEE